MAENNRLDTLELTVDAQPLPAELYGTLTLVRVEESVQLPDTFLLRFDDPQFELLDRGLFTIGTTIEVAFRAEDDAVAVTGGEITAIAIEQGREGLHELVLTGFDLTHRLAREPKTRSFVQMTDADIVGQVADEYGFAAQIEATGEVHPHVLQYDETDYAFLSRLARRDGFDFWIADQTLHYSPRPSSDAAPPVLRWGDNLHRFKVRISAAERCDEVTVQGWDPVAKRTIVGRATSGDTGTTASAAVELADDARRAFGPVRRFAGRFPVETQADADRLAASLLLRASGSEVFARGEAAGDPMLAAGSEVEVEQVGERMSGRYLVTSVRHVFTAGAPYVTQFVCGGKDPTALPDLLTSAAGRRSGPDGVVTGVVTNCDDPERLGRVKVKFSWLTDHDETTWARVASPGAGSGRGLQFLPEVGDEVLVAFEHADVGRPVIVGGLWNREDPLPAADAVTGGLVSTRVLTSRAGHRLEFTDDGTGAATLALADDRTALVLETGDSSLIGQQRLSVQAQEVRVTADRKLTLSAPQIEISADAEVKVSGGVIRLN